MLFSGRLQKENSNLSMKDNSAEFSFFDFPHE